MHIVDQIFRADRASVHRKVFYLVDDPQISVREWACTIQNELGRKMPIPTVPLPILYLAAAIGTLAKKCLGVEPPLTLFRLGNMMTGMKLDLTLNQSLFGEPPYSNREGVKATIEWLQEQR